MSVNIDSVTISAVVDQRIVLGNSSWAGLLNIGNDWNTLRICFRACFDDTGANITGTPRLYIGVLSNPSVGVANGPLGGATSHFVGVRSSYATWTRNVSNTRYSGTSSGEQLVKIIGAAVTTAGATGPTSAPQYSALPSTNRSPILFEVVKGSPNYSIRSTTSIQTTVSDKTYATLVDNMSNPDWASAASGVGAGATGAAQTIAASESDGILNAVCIAWDRSTPVIRISEVLISKIA